MSEIKPRAIKFQCPLISKTVEMVVREDQRVDLGSIARAFGLVPHTVKLNRHFISSGVDNVAYSVTWNSLLSYFSYKRLTDVIIVDGKLSSAGTKRSREPQDSASNVTQSKMEETEFSKSKKPSEGHSGETEATLNEGIGFQKSELLEDLSLIKRLRINENCSATSNNRVASNILQCKPMSGTKRMREDEIEDKIMAAPYKKMM